MEALSQLSTRLNSLEKPHWLLLAVVGGVAFGAAAMYVAQGTSSSGTPASAHSLHENGKQDDHDVHGDHESGTVHLPKEKWQTAGIRVALAEQREFTQGKWVTGKLALNEDRLAHIYSLVEGIVHQVPVRLGQRVKAGDILAVIDSKEVGQAKLAFVKSQLATNFAQVEYDWKLKINKNTQALIRAFQQNIPIDQITQEFHDKPIGEYREKLVSSYARLHQTQADYERLKDLSSKGISAEKDFLKAKADYEAAAATYQALMEQLKFTAGQQLLDAKQRLDETRMNVEVSRSLLLIMGYDERQMSRMNPLQEGEEVAHYTVMAPFDGAVIRKDVVFDERVGSDTQLFEIADLSAVWVNVDIFEKDLALLQTLHDKKLRFRVSGYLDRYFEAQVFYTGDIVDKATRTLRLMAVTQNSDGLLKPGMFVEVELPARTFANVLQVPIAAIQEYEGKQFVFVHQGGEEFERRDVTVGRQTDGTVEITTGLSVGERVVVEGTFALKSELLSGLIGEDE